MSDIYSQVSYGKWCAWKDRLQLENITMPGIYAIIRTSNDYSGKNFCWTDPISYIGMTVSKGGLASRLYQFQNSIIGKTGHSGGNTIKKYCDDYNIGHYDLENQQWSDGHKLFVCIHPVIINKEDSFPEVLIKKGIVANLEYLALSKFAALHNNKLPEYNKANSNKIILE
ncbi:MULTISPECIES: hypothetical protein [Providencia]|uniref:hypothetical protein n=1 Tax=Providencia TaxID=586 RepID=UPI001ADC2DF0|nr:MULTISPECIES: hypothetical protein [Providencia]MBO8256383.1 hypothetical protein [Providencia rettgeri]MBO8260230.1 hypothetical protein [Providencia rettgeri]MDE4731557.1 hypothetical protein [Providencia rettgeri]